ncbi:HAMP domain-containing sensor histidine kinase [Persicobacter psychrovividus]|uniref:histidine kinase n=1 Tax=Persicobacter psychrovividus TaxID=387638 RepID=A0ABN6L815_9BACT|nr:hypothetical protein PEPS_16010 [Persicobacter psychrovividus]
MRIKSILHKIFGTGQDYPFEGRVLNIINLLGALASIINVLNFSKLGLPIAFFYGFLYVSIEASCALLVYRYFKNYKAALWMSFTGESVILFLEWRYLGGLMGTFPFLLIAFHIINYNLIKPRYHWWYFSISTLVLFVFITVNSVMPEIVQTIDIAINVRALQYFGLSMISNITLMFFRVQDQKREHLHRRNVEHQGNFLNAIEKDYFLARVKNGKEISYISDAVNNIFPQMSNEDVKDIVLQLVRPSFEVGTNHQFDKSIEVDGIGYFLRVNQRLTLEGTTVIQHLVIQDLTLQKQQQQKLTARLDQQVALNKVKNEFISTVSHQFRTPLTTIQTANEIMKMYVEDTGLQGMGLIQSKFNQIFESIESLKSMLKHLLVFGQLEKEKIEINFESLDLVTFIDEKLEQQREITQRNITFEVLGRPSKAYVDLHAFEHIIMNLVSNAIKYSPEDTAVKVVLVFKREVYLLRVQDFGIGVSESEIEHLFVPFYRAKNTENHKGTGIGLAFVKRFVDLHAGMVTVESVEGQGATFIIEMPYETADNKIEQTLMINE